MSGMGRRGRRDLWARSDSVGAGWVDGPRLAVPEQLLGTFE